MTELNQVTSTPVKPAATGGVKKKVAARKAQPKVKAKAKATRKSTTSRFRVDPEKKIHLVAKENPRRPGTKRFKRFAAYKNGISVAALLKKSKLITRRGIGYDVKQHLISLS